MAEKKQIKDMNIVIQSKNCFCCGENINVTMHHAIPHRMNPKTNVLIPLCDKCHKELHVEDVRGLIDLVYKHMMELNSIARKLEKYIQLKEKTGGTK